MTPKAVVFDIGNVLLDFDYRKTAQAIQQRCKIPIDQIHSLIVNSPHFVQFETGEIDGAKFFTEFQRLSGFDGTVEDFLDPIGDIFIEIPEMIAFNERLQARGIPTYILSNTNEFSIRWIRKRYPFFANFTDYVFSHEVRCMKPGAHIYEVVEEKSGLSGPDLFYMDDKPENVAAAELRGWRAVIHTRPAQTLEIASKLGLS